MQEIELSVTTLYNCCYELLLVFKHPRRISIAPEVKWPTFKYLQQT